MLEPHLKVGTIREAEKADVLELLALCYEKKGDIAKAEDAYRRILTKDPSWSPDSLLSPPEATEVYLRVLAEIRGRRPWYQKPFGLLGNIVGVAGLGGLAVFIVEKMKDDKPPPPVVLPPFPDPPSNPQ